MNTFKLKTSSGTHRELDLAECAVYQRLPDKIYDAIQETIDGTQTVAQRARRRAFRLAIDGISTSELATLKAMYGDRQEFYIEGNVGEHTTLYNTFDGSRVPLVGSSSGWARASIATYQHADGTIREMVTGFPRYEACKMGRGILLEVARTNYFFPSHGASGVTIWTTHVGSPAVAWDGNVASNVYGKTGTIRVIMANADAVTTTVSGLVNTQAYSAYVWMRGSGTVTMSVNGATGVLSSGAVFLSMNWQRVSIEGFIPTATSVDLRITANTTNTQLWLSAHQLEDGYTLTSYIPTTVAAATRAMDQLYYTAPVNYAEGSVAFWIRWPRTSGSDSEHRHIWYAAGNFFATIYSNGTLSFSLGSGNVIAISQATHGFVPGDIVHLAFVWMRGYAAIIVNGVQRVSTTNNIRQSGSAAILQLYYTTLNANTVIDDLRVDNRYVEWRTSEGGLFTRYEDAENLEVVKLAQGRRFRIRNAEFARTYESGKFNGQLDVEESWSSADHTIEAA